MRADSKLQYSQRFLPSLSWKYLKELVNKMGYLEIQTDYTTQTRTEDPGVRESCIVPELTSQLAHKHSRCFQNLLGGAEYIVLTPNEVLSGSVVYFLSWGLTIMSEGQGQPWHFGDPHQDWKNYYGLVCHKATSSPSVSSTGGLVVWFFFWFIIYQPLLFLARAKHCRKDDKACAGANLRGDLSRMRGSHWKPVFCQLVRHYGENIS